MTRQRTLIALAGLSLAAATVLAPQAVAVPKDSIDRAARVAASWTAAARAAAIPRDIVRSDAGHWYLRGADGRLHPYGMGAAAAPVEVKGRPGGARPKAVTNAQWTGRGAVQTAAGRLYFRMWDDGYQDYIGYVCSGTVVPDTLSGYSMVLTAAHCVYDDVANEFARDVLFIPDQAGTTAAGTNTVCADDPMGCWWAEWGAVDRDWMAADWPANIPYDYGFYLVPAANAHITGLNPADDALEVAAGTLPIAWTTSTAGGDYAYALGYSYKDDPKLMYCAQALGEVQTTVDYRNWWLSKCALSGGASGGPWMQPALGTTTLLGSEAVFSVNSWGYSGKPGMAGPKLQSDVTVRPLGVYNAANALTSNSYGVVGPLDTWVA